ncbi:TonB-dependent receptor [Catalinimonas niigatensis]|uniref:hypothetical protein n=1 Tax=Catalinimonas niigatensis TaxID=1397264 RepID=UPI002665AC00|nr:hypothetical protein [Catalinimonas niigatensis]WPP52081.1 hypothetical protein PZB72_06770 [Catalinimonas niigatensis]
MQRFSHIFIILSIFMLGISFSSYAQFRIDLESGAVFTGYNKIQVPGTDGTRFNLTDELDVNNSLFYRLKLLYTFNDKHTFSVLFAPLSIKAQGYSDQTIQFAGATFAAGDALNTRYVFNSYRLTYRYLFPRKGDFQFGLGATAKIRDALIRIEDEEKSATKTNVGFVPLINFQLEWFAKEKLSLLLQGDALVSTQGRAEDVLLAALFYPSQNVTLKAGYRILEGGADNDEVYNFSLIHYAVIGGIVRF